MVRIETELVLNPSAAYVTVAQRLDALAMDGKPFTWATTTTDPGAGPLPTGQIRQNDAPGNYGGSKLWLSQTDNLGRSVIGWFRANQAKQTFLLAEAVADPGRYSIWWLHPTTVYVTKTGFYELAGSQGNNAGTLIDGEEVRLSWGVWVAPAWQTGHTWAVMGALAAATLPGIFIPKLAAQTATLKGVRAKLGAGTSVVAQMRRNGTNLGSAITVTATAATTSFNQALSADDVLDVVLSAPTGSPVDLSLTAYFEHLAG